MVARTQYQDFLADIPRFRSLGRVSRAAHVKNALNTSRAIVEPGYALAVLHHYAQSKVTRGKSKIQLHGKLEALEMAMPHFGNDFRLLRQQLELIPSRVLPNGEIGAPPPPYPASTHIRPHCSCTCTCGAQVEPPEEDVALDALASRNFSHISVPIPAGPVSLRPSSPFPSSLSAPSTSSSVSSMSTLTGASGSMSTDALSSLALAPGLLAQPGSRRRPLSMIMPRFRVGSSSSTATLASLI